MSELLLIKNIEFLDKCYPGFKKLVEERKEKLLTEEKLEVLEHTTVNGEVILSVRTEERHLWLAGKRRPSAAAENQINLLGKIVPNAPVFVIGMGNMEYLRELWRVADTSIITFVYEPSFSIFYKQMELVDLEKLLGNRLMVLVVKGINDVELKSAISTVLVPNRVPLMKHFVLPNYETLFLKEIYISYVYYYFKTIYRFFF